MKRLFTMLTVLLFLSATIRAVPCVCLTQDNKLEEINDIKKDSAYLYADVTMPTQELATSQAYEQLQREVINWVTEQLGDNTEDVSAVEINRVVDTLVTRRADMYRVFAYACKTDILSTFTTGHACQHALMSADSTKHIVANDTICHLLKQSFLGRNGGVIEQIKKARNFFELKQIMEPLKEKGDILDYGKYASAENPEDCYLIVYDPAGNIRALLGTGKDSRWNLKTGKDDSLTNYRGCGAIWFILKNEN